MPAYTAAVWAKLLTRLALAVRNLAACSACDGQQVVGGGPRRCLCSI